MSKLNKHFPYLTDIGECVAIQENVVRVKQILTEHLSDSPEHSILLKELAMWLNSIDQHAIDLHNSLLSNKK